jgi:hypothetical protein
MHSTWGDRAREVVRQRGLLFFPDVLAEIGARLAPKTRCVLAAACAEPLLSRHLRLPMATRWSFTAGWRRPLDCVWGVLGGGTDAARLRSEVAEALRRFHEGPHDHDAGQDGHDDADHDPAAACIHAAESLLQDSPESAAHAASRLVNDAFSRAADELDPASRAADPVAGFIEECCRPFVQRELEWIRGLIACLESHPLTGEIVTEIRDRAGA